MSAIGPGDWVEALGPRGAVSWTGARAGGVYCVEALVSTAPCDLCPDDHPGLHLFGIQRHPHGWAGCQFRPIYRPKADLIEQLKQPAPDAVRELEDV